MVVTVCRSCLCYDGTMSAVKRQAGFTHLLIFLFGTFVILGIGGISYYLLASQHQPAQLALTTSGNAKASSNTGDTSQPSSTGAAPTTNSTTNISTAPSADTPKPTTGTNPSA